MNRAERMFIDIWEGIKFAFKTAPVPAIFLVVWVTYVIWAASSL